MATAVLMPRESPWVMAMPSAIPSAKLWSPSPMMINQARGFTAFSHLHGGVVVMQEHVPCVEGTEEGVGRGGKGEGKGGWMGKGRGGERE